MVAFLLVHFVFDVGPQTPDPPRDFQRLTGWTLPSDAQVLRAENTFSGFNGDRDYTLIVQTSPRFVVESISAEDWDAWKQCPIPEDIQDNCWNLPKHEGVRYRAEKVNFADADWHRGTLVIVNPATGVIWVYSWKN